MSSFDEFTVSEDAHMRETLLAAEDWAPPSIAEADKLHGDEGVLKRAESVSVDKALQSSTQTLLRSTMVGPTDSQAFNQGKLTIIEQVLEEVDKTAKKRMKEGFNEINFTVGVSNCLLVAFVFGRYPQHFWLLYLIESCFFIPRKFLNMISAKPLNQALYYFDLCWMVNFTGVFFLSTVVLSSMYPEVVTFSDEMRKEAFVTAVGMSCGPLMGANGVLSFIAMLFHDVNTMTGFFIHVLPAMVMYTLMWHTDEIREAWPSVLHLDYLDDVRFFPAANDDDGPWWFVPSLTSGTVAGNALAFYFLWSALYTGFMLLMGLDLPNEKSKRRTKPKYDTVFHSTMRGGLAVVMGKALWNRSKSESVRQMEQNDFEVRDLLMYMLAHMTAAVFSTLVLGYACFTSQTIHGCLLVLIVVLGVKRGSQRYTYYATKMYGRTLRKQLTSAIESSDTELKKREEKTK